MEEPDIPNEVVSTLSEFNSIIEHYYQFAGDERFLSHLPASGAIKDELRSEISYLSPKISDSAG